MNDMHILTVELFRYAGLACMILLAVAALVLCLLYADAAAKARVKPARAEPAADPSVARRLTFLELSTLQLCETLRRSYLPLPNDPPEQGEWERVRLRGQLLDEIERRDPEGFHRWLATLPPAGSDPGRYLSVSG